MKQNVRLINAASWCDQGTWYMGLTYQYDEKDGKHVTVYPKVLFPFSTFAIPDVTPKCIDGHYAHAPIIYTIGSTPIFKAPVRHPVTLEYREERYAFDFLTEPAVRKMTVEEIEKELGYKVEIVEKGENQC